MAWEVGKKLGECGELTAKGRKCLNGEKEKWAMQNNAKRLGKVETENWLMNLAT